MRGDQGGDGRLAVGAGHAGQDQLAVGMAVDAGGERAEQRARIVRHQPGNGDTRRLARLRAGDRHRAPPPPPRRRRRGRRSAGRAGPRRGRPGRTCARVVLDAGDLADRSRREPATVQAAHQLREAHEGGLPLARLARRGRSSGSARIHRGAAWSSPSASASSVSSAGTAGGRGGRPPAVRLAMLPASSPAPARRTSGVALRVDAAGRAAPAGRWRRRRAPPPGRRSTRCPAARRSPPAPPGPAGPPARSRRSSAGSRAIAAAHRDLRRAGLARHPVAGDRRATCPVPSITTPSSSPLSTRAVAGRDRVADHRRRGVLRRPRLPPAHRRHHVRAQQRAAVGHRGGGAGELERRHRDPLAEGDVGLGRAGPQRSTLCRMPALSPGRSMPVGLPKPKLADGARRTALSPIRRATLMTPTLLDCAITSAKVSRPYGLWSRTRMSRKRVIDRPSRSRKRRSRPHHAGLQGRGGGDDLERRARLVDVGDRPVAPAAPASSSPKSLGSNVG